ncbi:hypothetical protein FRB99_002293 [Tulasnella sp. 403]|nr:hypothetical protein FRB99_002293 [Tulasnella sp. 403]
MPLIDTIKDAAAKFIPQRKQPGIPMPVSTSSGGIGSGPGIASFEDEMPLSKAAIVFYTLQIFFCFLAMCCFASVASFQKHWGIGVSGLSGFAILVAVTGILLSALLLLVPVIYDKYDRLVRFARAIREERIQFILSGTGFCWLLLISFVTTISVFTQPGCKDPNKDPHADLGDDFKKQLPGWCTTKKAGAVFFWLAFAGWCATVGIVVMEWRDGKVRGRRPRDPPFSNPIEHSQEESETASYYQAGRSDSRPLSQPDDDDEPRSPFNDPPQARYGTGPAPSLPPVDVGGHRPSMDTYGAFSDPAPSGYLDPPEGISRTMAYADPYVAVRANIGPRETAPSSQPPSYQY